MVDFDSRHNVILAQKRGGAFLGEIRYMYCKTPSLILFGPKLIQGGHGTGKTGNLAVNFSRQEEHREFSKFNFLHRENCANTGKILKI